MEKRDLDIIFNNSVDWSMFRNKCTLITGATGRLGRFILETLVEADLRYNLNARIIGMARNKKKAFQVFGNTLQLPNVVFIYQDVNDKITYEGQIDYIFHTAGPAAPLDFKNFSVETLWAHVNGTHNVLECAREHKTRRVLYVSTVEIYGEFASTETISESDMGPLFHVNSRASYPEAKRVCETMLASYKEEYGIDFCGVRFSHTIGPGIDLCDGRAFAEFIKCTIDQQNIVLTSDGSAMRTYTYVADGINAIFLIMDKGESTFYNVAADENLISIRDLAAKIAGYSLTKGTQVVYSKEASQLPYLPYRLPIMDTSKVRELGWKPQVNIDETLRRTVESFF